MRDESGGGEDRGDGRAGSGREAWGAGATESISLDFGVGIVDALVIAGAPDVVLGARGLLWATIFRWSLDAARRRVAALVSRISSLSSLGIE